jgi:dTMP kinase
MSVILPKNKNGKFIVLEGLDGSGKSVQYGLLCEYLRQNGHNVAPVDFPNYEGSFHGKLVGRYLRGEFGDTYEVNPYFSSWLYAGDRLEAKEKLEAWLEEGRTLVANRYTGSNLAYHSVKLPPEQRPGFIDWLKSLEYVTNAIPKEDAVIYLHVPVATAQRMVDRKAARSYTSERRDIHERDTDYLQEVNTAYLGLCQSEPNWFSLEVADPASSELLPAEEIHRRLIGLLQEQAVLQR